MKYVIKKNKNPLKGLKLSGELTKVETTMAVDEMSKIDEDVEITEEVYDMSEMLVIDKNTEDEVFMECKYNDMAFSDYIISNFGEVWSFKGKEPRRLKPSLDKGDYLYLTLVKDRKRYCCRLHRLVICSHQEVPENWRELHVNHLDEDKSNNCLSNLKWLTATENNNWGTRNERQAKTRSKTVYQFSKNGEFIREWQSTMEIERQLGFCHSHISKCCRGLFKTMYNYRWSYQPTLD